MTKDKTVCSMRNPRVEVVEVLVGGSNSRSRKGSTLQLTLKCGHKYCRAASRGAPQFMRCVQCWRTPKL